MRFFTVFRVMLCFTITWHAFPSVEPQQQTFCDPSSDPNCRTRMQQRQLSDEPVLPRPAFDTNQRPSANAKCRYQDIWLIPGRADAACTRRRPQQQGSPISIDPRHVTIRPAVIKFPGCFTVDIANIRIDELQQGAPSESIFAKVEYQWLNIPEFSASECQNSSANGCGGFGNNCYYCNICENLEGADGHANGGDDSMIPREISHQLRGLNCPRSAGSYSFRKQFCFNNWEVFDRDKNCRLDFLDSEQSDAKMALLSLQQIGYGTVIAKVRLAFNASAEVNTKIRTKLSQIEKAAAREIDEQRQTSSLADDQLAGMKKSLVEAKQNAWHRNDFLPWLLFENEFACFRIAFDVCERQPTRRPDGLGFSCG